MWRYIIIVISVLGIVGVLAWNFHIRTQSTPPQDNLAYPTHTASHTPTPATSTVPLEEMLGSLFMVGHWVYTPLGSTTERIATHHIGGVIVMSAPTNTAEIFTWTQHWQELSSSTLFIATDQEGGVVQRVKGPGFTSTSQRDIESTAEAYELGKKRGGELHALGINMNFAPVLDTAQNPNSFLYPRTFTTASSAPLFTDAMVRGFKDSGVIAVPKHFPGHDDTTDDSHFTLPRVLIAKESLPAFIKPFSTYLEHTPPEGIMTAHVLFPNITDVPATLSSFFLTDLLRTRYNFQGLIITDDMSMDAIDTNYTTEEATIKAIEAGADILLFAAEPERVLPALAALTHAVKTGRISRQRIEESYTRIHALKNMNTQHYETGF